VKDYWTRRWTYIAAHADICEVIRPGGDPFILSSRSRGGFAEIIPVFWRRIFRTSKSSFAYPKSGTRSGAGERHLVCWRCMRRANDLGGGVHANHAREFSPSAKTRDCRVLVDGAPLGSHRLAQGRERRAESWRLYRPSWSIASSLMISIIPTWRRARPFPHWASRTVWP